MNYGMNKIHEVDFWNILDGLECEVVKDEATVQSEELQPIHDYSVGDFVISFENVASVEKRLSEYSKLLKKKKCATKVDFNQVNINNKKLGTAGELVVLELENEKLFSLGLPLKAEHVSVTIGDGLGYDILSYDQNGNEIFIEVKTTRTANKANFYMSKNELLMSELEKEKYKIYRLYNFDETTHHTDMEIYDGAVSSDTFEVEPVTFIVKSK